MANLLLAVIYIAFISLGLPDAVLGAAWPTMSGDLHAPISWAGGISMTISAGTIVSALLSDRMTLRFGAGKVTAVSVALTAFALFGFSISPNYWMLLLFAIPYGLGAGGVDAALNNYVAIHYESRHMSWLHAMWGLGTLLGPYIMASALGAGHGWAWGYRTISILQVVLTAVLVLSLPLWKARKTVEPQRTSETSSVQSAQSEQSEGETADRRKPLGIRGVLAIRGAREILVMFFCYCAVESTAGLWASSYMVMHSGIDKITAASWASLFYVGITVGRALSGFLTMRFKDPVMIRLGQVLVFAGILTMFVPLPHHLGVVVGLVVIGFGCAPIYPCVIHSTPAYFGEDKSQAIVGVQMACAYVGSLLMPPLFGIIAQYATISLYPWYLLVLLVLMVAMRIWARRLLCLEPMVISEEEHEQMPEPVRERLEALKDAPGSVIVVGSMNADYTVTTKRLPKPGETVNGGAMKVLPGGKGANQASAAARLGVNVQLLGAVGEDSNADFLLSKLDEAGVDTADILHVEGPSGTTVITVSAEGENTIVYSPGSNAKASAGYVQSHRTTIAECAVLGLCLESPIATVIAAAQTAHDAGVTVLLNDSPFMDELPHELVEATDILLVNQHEVAQLLGLPDDDVESLDWYEVAERFTDYGFDRAIVTLGASGSVVIENGRWHRVSAAQVNAVDTTGCGDSFMGTVLAGLAAGHTLLQSAQIGSYVSAYAATKLGAQSAYGTAEEVIAYFS